LEHLVSSYKLWQEYLSRFPRVSRYTLGETIDLAFIATIELVFTASSAVKEQKPVFLQRASNKLDLVKFLLRIGWEIQALDNKKYIALSEKLSIVGKMLGGWLRQASKP